MEVNDIFKGRLTGKKFIDWLNMKFKEFEITEYVVTGVERTRFRMDDYHAGACKMYVRFDYADVSKRGHMEAGYFLCFFNLSEYDDHIKNGYEMYLTFDESRGSVYSLINLTVRLRKKLTPTPENINP